LEQNQREIKKSFFFLFMPISEGDLEKAKKIKQNLTLE
jgi:hypothetical protein